MPSQDVIGGAFFLLMGAVFLILRAPIASYLTAIYPATMLPERGALSWMVVLFGVGFFVIGGSLLLQLV